MRPSIPSPISPASLLSLAMASLMGASGAWASAPAPVSASSRIYDGEPAKTCEWPSAVHFVGVCTGTLVHPRIILYAAHCKLSKEEVMFGENYKNAHGKTVKAKYCHKNPKFKNFAKGEDYAYCLLEEEVTNVPIAPIAYGCEIDQIKAGAEIMLVGFGQIKAKTYGTKHKGKSKINKLVAKGTEIQVGGSEVATTCYGDSGGPAFLQLSDGTWRTIGIVSYGTHKSCEYPSGLTLPHVAVPWIHKDLKKNGIDDIDLLPCYNEDGSWNPKEGCTKFPLAHGSSTANWDSMCSEGAKLSGPSTICAPKDEEAPTLEWAKLKEGDEIPEATALEVTINAQDNSKLDPQVTLWANDKELKTLKEPPYTWTLEKLEPGELKLRARATDAANNEATLDSITLEVIEEEPDPGENDSDVEPSEPTPSSTEGSGTTGEDSGEDSGDNSDSGEPGEDPSSDSEGQKSDQSAQAQNNSGRKGCSLANPKDSSPAPWSALALFWGAAAWRRRNARR